MPVTSSASAIKAGTVAHFAANSAPAGWIKANGAAISRASYAALFLAIGTTHGAGDGSTTFNIPDLRGEFLRSLDDGRGVDSGRAIGTAQNASMANHGHWRNGSGANERIYRRNGTGWSDTGAGAISQADETVITGGVSDGTAYANETRPRNVALLACIKY